VCKLTAPFLFVPHPRRPVTHKFQPTEFRADEGGGGAHSLTALYSDFVIGAICCRLEKTAAAANSARLYIMTLGVFAPYRRRKVGARLLDHIMTAAAADSTVDDVYLHVQVPCPPLPPCLRLCGSTATR